MNNYAYPDSEEEYKKRKKGSFQHKLFKFIILIIVAVFFFLIFSFLKIEFFKSNSIDYKFDLNSDKYNYLEKIDNYFSYSKDNKNLDECAVDKFYPEHISDYKPCKISKNSKLIVEVENYIRKIKKLLIENKITVEDLKLSKKNAEENSINLLGFVNKIGFINFMETLDFDRLLFRFETENKKLETKAIAMDKNFFFIQLEGSREFRLSPITQINKLKPKRENLNENSIFFNPIESEEDLFKLESENKDYKKENYPKILKVYLAEGEILFVPSYFFVQEKGIIKNSNNSHENNISLKYEFNSNSRTLNSMFKVLFDDNLKLENEAY